MLLGLSAAGVSTADGCDDEDDCQCEEESGLMSIGNLCGGGKLGMIVSPGGSVVSWSPVLGNSPCVSLVFRHRVNHQ